MEQLTQSTAARIVFLLSDYTDNETGETGQAGSVTVEISKNGGAFAAATNTPVEITGSALGGGWYYLDLTTTETNTAGPLILQAQVSGSPDPVTNVWRYPYRVVAAPSAESTLSAATMNQIADHVIRRNLSSVDASSDGDAITGTCLLMFARGGVGVTKAVANGATITIYKEDNVTVAVTRVGVTNPNAELYSSIT